MTWAVYSAVDSTDVKPTELLEGLRAWAEEADVQPGCDGPEPHYRIALCTDPRGGAWLTFSEPRGDGALHCLRELARVAARVSGKSLQVLISGADDGSQSHTVLGYHAVNVDPDGEFHEHHHAGADAYLRDVNPVADDCPYEEFSELLDELIGAEHLDEFDEAGEPLECPGEFSSVRFCEDERLNGLIVAARGGAEYTLEAQDNGRTLVNIVHGDGTRQMTYLKAEELKRFEDAVRGRG